MVWALESGAVDLRGLELEPVVSDIQSLNDWALEGRLEVTALSAGAYSAVEERYVLLPHGASFGEGYGPIVVALGEVDLSAVEIVTPGPLTTAKRVLQLALGEAIRTRDLPFDEVLDEVLSGRAEAGLLIHEGQLTSADAGLTIAAPGAGTTAFATLRMAMPDARCVHMPFDEILPAVQRGEVDAGLLIHEGQLTWAREGVHKALDLGVWWKQETGLPLPLGINALRKDLGPALGARVNALLRAGIEAGLAHRQEALAYARGFGRGIPMADADAFVGMYVNELTRDAGARGRAAVEEWLRRAIDAKLIPAGSRADWAP